MYDIKKRLEQKGWKKKDIIKTANIIQKAKENKHPHIKTLDNAVYWISLGLAIIGNFLISISLIPLLLILKSFPLYLTIVTLGASFGLLFELLIRTIEHLETKHHLFLGIIIPIIALINLVVIVLISNGLEEILNIQNFQNPLLVGAAYAISFIFPFAIYHVFLKK